LLPAEDRPARAGIGRFYVRRAFRIVPLYYVVLTALALSRSLSPEERGALVYEYLYLTNYGPFVRPPVMPWAWSLCVEEHFYLVVPLLALALGRIGRPSLRIGALAALWLAGLAVRYAVFAARTTPWTANDMTFAIYIRTHTRFDVLVAGVLLAYVQRSYGPRIRAALAARWRRIALGSIAVVSAAALVGPLARRQDVATVFAWGTVTSVMYVALVLLLINTESALTRFLSSRWFLRFATLGYGIYLVHPPIITRVVLPVALVLLEDLELPLGVAWAAGLGLLLVVATAVAYGLHLVVEKPALWLRDRVAPPRAGA
jgi:peptidoglycan/LPS O-acetylase OafA/YrhL